MVLFKYWTDSFLTLRKHKIHTCWGSDQCLYDIPDIRLWPTSSSDVNSEVNNLVIYNPNMYEFSYDAWFLVVLREFAGYFNYF
jgi:hypothetical protein